MIVGQGHGGEVEAGTDDVIDAGWADDGVDDGGDGRTAMAGAARTTTHAGMRLWPMAAELNNMKLQNAEIQMETQD